MFLHPIAIHDRRNPFPSDEKLGVFRIRLRELSGQSPSVALADGEGRRAGAAGTGPSGKKVWRGLQPSNTPCSIAKVDKHTPNELSTLCISKRPTPPAAGLPRLPRRKVELHSPSKSARRIIDSISPPPEDSSRPFTARESEEETAARAGLRGMEDYLHDLLSERAFVSHYRLKAGVDGEKQRQEAAERISSMSPPLKRGIPTTSITFQEPLSSSLETSPVTSPLTSPRSRSHRSVVSGQTSEPRPPDARATAVDLMQRLLEVGKVLPDEEVAASAVEKEPESVGDPETGDVLPNEEPTAAHRHPKPPHIHAEGDTEDETQADSGEWTSATNSPKGRAPYVRHPSLASSYIKVIGLNMEFARHMGSPKKPRPEQPPVSKEEFPQSLSQSSPFTEIITDGDVLNFKGLFDLPRRPFRNTARAPPSLPPSIAELNALEQSMEEEIEAALARVNGLRTT